MDSEKLTLVLMAGLPGAGKTSLAYELSKTLTPRCYTIDRDRIKEDLLQAKLDDDKAGKDAYDRAFAMARNALAEQYPWVILDSAALSSTILEETKKIVLSVANAQLKIILLVADWDLREQRLRDRPPHIPGNKFESVTRDEHSSLFKHLLPEDPLILDTARPISECLDEAISYLKKTNDDLDKARNHLQRNDVLVSAGTSSIYPEHCML